MASPLCNGRHACADYADRHLDKTKCQEKVNSSFAVLFKRMLTL
jgi:hypothetical protein